MKTALQHLQEKKPYVSSNYVVGVTKDGTATMYQTSTGTLIGVHSALGMHLRTTIANTHNIPCTSYNDEWSAITQEPTK